MILFLLVIGIYYICFVVLKLKPDRSHAPCGIFGFSGTFPADRTKIRWLAALNESRGRDSTGVWGLKGDKKLTQTLAKSTTMSSKYILEDEFNHAIDGVIATFGHTRLATQGAVNVENAHPFKFNFGLETVGVHNGFIVSQLLGRYLSEYGLENEFDKDKMCDSQIIFAILSKLNGDWNRLPELEGGITTVFAFPTRHERTLFAYKREARSLFYGYAPEGIYFSSESGALEQIGCYNISAFEDHSLTVMKDGAILDFMPLEKPKIIIPYLATEKSWANSATKSEKESYEELKVLNNYSAIGNNSWKKKHKNFSSLGNKAWEGYGDDYEGFPPAQQRKFISNGEDKFKMLMNDVISEIKDIKDEVKVAAIANSECSIDEVQDCIVVIKLQDSVKRNPLPGWSVHDKDDINMAGITMLNGVTVLHYPIKDIREDEFRLIQIYDPVDGKSLFTYSIKPKASRILEVILEIPFPQTQTIQTSGTKTNSSSGESNVRSNDSGQNGDDGNVSGSSKQVLMFSNRDGDRKPVQEQEESIHIRRKEESLSSGQDDDENRIKYLRRRRHLTYPDSFVTSLTTRVYTGRKPAAWADMEQEIEHLKLSKDYQQTYLTLNYYLDDLIDVEELVTDAAILRLDDIRQDKQVHTIKTYSTILITEDIVSYHIGKDLVRDRIKIDMLIDKFAANDLAKVVNKEVSDLPLD